MIHKYKGRVAPNTSVGALNDPDFGYFARNFFRLKSVHIFS